MSSLFPCPEFLRDCDCSAYPVRNFSQESPDVPVFFGHYDQPPIVGSFFSPSCLGICESTISQEQADLCAQRAAFQCSIDRRPVHGNFIPNGPHTHGNTLQECTKECSDSTCAVTSVVAPGTVVTATQADADARAHGQACKEAQKKVICFVTGSSLEAVHAD